MFHLRSELSGMTEVGFEEMQSFPRGALSRCGFVEGAKVPEPSSFLHPPDM